MGQIFNLVCGSMLIPLYDILDVSAFANVTHNAVNCLFFSRICVLISPQSASSLYFLSILPSLPSFFMLTTSYVTFCRCAYFRCAFFSFGYCLHPCLCLSCCCAAPCLVASLFLPLRATSCCVPWFLVAFLWVATSSIPSIFFILRSVAFWLSYVRYFAFLLSEIGLPGHFAIVRYVLDRDQFWSQSYAGSRRSV